jgi:hypothetical protein
MRGADGRAKFQKRRNLKTREGPETFGEARTRGRPPSPHPSPPEEGEREFRDARLNSFTRPSEPLTG